MDEIFPSADSSENQEVSQPDTAANEVQPLELQEVAETGQVDNDKAWDMAYAGKTERDRAAEIRQKEIPALEQALIALPEAALGIRKPSEQKVSLGEQLRDEYGFDDESKTRREELLAQQNELEERVEKLLESKSPEIRDALFVIFRDIYRYGDAKDFDELLEGQRKDLSRRKGENERSSARLDASGEILEKWAEILHDHPVSDAFKERFGLGEVTPKILARLEAEIKARERKNRDLKDYIYPRVSQDWANMGKNFEPSHLDREVRQLAGGNTYTDDTRLSSIVDLAYVPGSEEYLEYKKVMDDPQVPVDVKRDTYMQAFEKFIDNNQLELRLKKTFLEDIRTGRAAQWQ